MLETQKALLFNVVSLRDIYITRINFLTYGNFNSILFVSFLFHAVLYTLSYFVLRYIEWFKYKPGNVG